MLVDYLYQSKGRERKRLISLEQLVDLMQSDQLRKRTEALTEAIRISRVVGAQGHLDATESLPVVNFSNVSESPQRLVLLSFRVADAELLRRLETQARSIPQTVMTFAGLSGQTLKVVTAVSDNQDEFRDAQSWQNAAYLSAANFYGQALGVAPEGHEQGRPMLCRVGHCPSVWLNPSFVAVPVVGDGQTDKGPRDSQADRNQTDFDSYSDLELQLAKFNYIFEQLSFEKETDEETYLCTLAERCRKAGVEEEVAVKSLLHVNAFRNKDFLVRSTFRTAYNDHPLGCDTEMSQKIVDQYRFESFMNRRYRFRRNRVTDVVEYRELGLYLLSWRPLDTQVLNSITLQALREGIGVWDKDVRRYVNSIDIAAYDPITEYLYRLPRWDGKDRLKSMAARVTTSDALWEDNFKIWMRSMVSQWMGRNRMYGSSMVLMLTGAQGTGKSTFIRLLMPPELMAFYLDRLDFTNKKEAEKALARFALINIDEFDQISPSQTAYLKHLLQKSSITQRKLFEDSYTQSRRYAAFAATTNCPQPLTDPTGSRRYMVEDVKEPIDVRTTGDHAIDYGQMYAQVVVEIRQGAPTYFDASRERQIQNHNISFTIQEPLYEAFNVMFRKPNEGSSSTLRLSPMEILRRIHQQFVGIRADRSTAIKLGRYLTQERYHQVSTHERLVYEVVERS
jgi:hypothetical protein